MMLRLGVLDLDGTLTNTAILHLKAWRDALTDLGLLDEVRSISVEYLLGRRAIDIATALVGAGPQAWRLVRLKTMYYLDLLSNGLDPFPCAMELLDETHELGIMAAVVTSSSRSSALAVLKATRLLEKVDYVVAGDDVEKGKPDPLPIRLALDRFNVMPKQAYGIGDTIYDVEAYRAAGLGLVMSLNPINGAIHVKDLCEAINVIKRAASLAL